MASGADTIPLRMLSGHRGQEGLLSITKAPPVWFIRRRQLFTSFRFHTVTVTALFPTKTAIADCRDGCRTPRRWLFAAPTVLGVTKMVIVQFWPAAIELPHDEL
jgi:hypothetical protein